MEPSRNDKRTASKRKSKTSRDEKSLKYKAFIGNKTEGQGFADKRKRKIVYQYRKIEQKEKDEHNSWAEKLQKLYDEADNLSDDDIVNEDKKSCRPITVPVTKSSRTIAEHDTQTSRPMTLQDTKNALLVTVPEKKMSRSNLAQDKKKNRPIKDSKIVSENTRPSSETLSVKKSSVSSPANVPVEKLSKNPSKADQFKLSEVPAKKGKVSSFHREEQEWKQKKLEIDQRREEAEARQKAKISATERYRKEKTHKYKLLAKRNYKGQPNMAARMSLLLEKIEKQAKS